MSPTLFQFTPLREGRHVDTLMDALQSISIHAPPRGATFRDVRESGRRENFNSRPSARGDSTSTRKRSTVLLFQFTPLREGRRRCGRSTTKSKAFQFTPLREGRPGSAATADAAKRFQFTPLREGRRRPAWRTCRNSNDFNSRPSARGDRNHGKVVLALDQFQFTPLREGRRYVLPPLYVSRRYFNSRPSARGDVRQVEGRGQAHISIHAPPRGATEHHPPAGQRHPISIHAPPRGATHEGFPILQSLADFNSRPSARGDAVLRGERAETQMISIHAPPRGATVKIGAGRSTSTFQFTPLREGRPRSWRRRTMIR